MNSFIKSLLAASLALAGTMSAFGQSNPGLVQGQVPTAAQWNSYFSAKQDVLSGTPLSTLGGTMLGPLLLAPSAAGAAGVNVAPGVAPTTPNNGDLWVTAAGIFARVNGVSVNLTTASSGLSTSGGTMTGELIIAASSSPNSGINFQIGVAPTAPANGDFWTTAADAFIRINGATINLTTIAAGRLPAFGSGDVSCAAAGASCTIAGNAVTNAKLATASQNTVKGAATSTAEADLAVPSCSAATSALTWTSGSGFGCNTITPGGGGLVSIVTYSGTQTITIPATATKGYVKMWGGSGGSGGINGAVVSATGGTGAAGYLEKYLTSLTAGNTLAYTQGALGSAGVGAGTGGPGGNGTASTLASGSQTITTLTANGSNGSTGVNNAGGVATAGTAGGTATNGDTNITGIDGADSLIATTSPNGAGSVGGPAGGSLYAPGAKGVGSNNASITGIAGRSGGLIVYWFQ